MGIIMKKLKVAIIGSGFTGEAHADTLRRIPNVEIVALVDSNIEYAQAKAEKMGINLVLDDYKKLLSKTSVDAVHNCTPNNMHYEINKYFMQRNIHVYCEKPLCSNIGQAKKLLQLQKEKNIAFGVNFLYRNNAAVQDMRFKMLNNKAGNLYLVRGEYLQDWLMYDTDFNWRITEAGARAVSDIGSHWFDTAQFTTGQKIVSVSAEYVTALPVRKKMKTQGETFSQNANDEFEEVEIKNEDIALIHVKFESGLMGSLVISQVSGGYKNALKIALDCANYSMEWQQESSDKIYIGTREFGSQKVYVSPQTVAREARRYAFLPAGHAVAWNDALRNSFREYYDSIDRNTFMDKDQTYATLSDALYVMQISDACTKSNKTKKWVNVE